MPEVPPQQQPDDPVVSRSLGLLLLVSLVLLLATVGWSLWDEFYGLRPWRGYQTAFRGAYGAYLDKQIAARRAAEKAFQATPDYQRLSAAVQSTSATALPGDRQTLAEVDLLDRQRAAMTPDFQDARGRVGSLVYQMEQIPESDRSGREAAQKRVMDAKAITYDVDWPTAEGMTQRKFNYDQLNGTFADIMARKAALVAQRGQNDLPTKSAQTALDEFTKERLPGLSASDLTGLLNSVRGMSITLRQVNVNPPGAQINWLGGAGLVDRCQSCHVATDPLIVPSVMTLTKADLGMANSKNAPFATHPNPALLKTHPLEKFGCSPCHGGNGRALDSVERAHGRYEHWLWPLNYPENFEAGCQQCHSADMVTEEARNLNHGKELFRSRGCIGCHRFQGFDNQDELLVAARQNILQLTSTKASNLLEVPRLNKLGDQASDNAAANRFYQQAINLNVTTANIDAQIEQLEQRSHNLLQDIKKVGPDLKEVRMKLRKEWIPYWLGNTHTFRPTTKMPQFRLQPDEIQALSAFVWQSGLTGPALPKQVQGNSTHGKQLLESRGCLACHSVGEGTAQMGGTFAANLSRVGEKDNYDYLVRWVHNPRERTRPYCSFEKRDLGPEDYAKHNLPYVFDADHSRCPNDGHELTVQQPTPMPNLRLSPEDARDVASYLITLKHADATYAAAPFMDDPALKDKGKSLAQFYGCAGCHEISGLEEEGRIGTELTTEGSKPVERLDFALLTENAKLGILPDGKPSPRGPWHDLKGFVENKLANPAVFDTGKYKPNSTDRLRMPKPNVTPADITALTTMLLGSTDPSLPADYMYKPSDDRAAIQKGWWIVSKYNCMGCHQVDIGQDSVLMGLPMYQGENKVNLPPMLTSEGARVNPEWLRRFLADPSLSGENANRNGVRPYLQVRMPTFSFSDDEVRALIAFFEAISHQPQQFVPQKTETLTTTEDNMARQLFTSTAAPCLKCHATGDPAHDAMATAPNFLLAKERLRAPWMVRWITNPQQLAPGTAMPSGLFRSDNERWVFAGPLPGAFQGYTGDHADLLVRYMLQLTPEEQRSLIGRTPTGAN